MPSNVPVMLYVLIALVLLPIRLSSLQLKGLAFFLWFLGGVFLAFRGMNFMLSAPDQPGWTLLAMIGVVALVVGWGKGQFVLTKTSHRNIARLDAFTQPMRPIYVYGLRSWIIIGIMVLIGLSLTWFNTPLLWRGAVNLAIGWSLIISSLVYVRALSPSQPPTTPAG